MTTQNELAKRRVSKYSHIKSLPDPPPVPDFRRGAVIMSFLSLLQMRYRRQGDTLISGGGYLCPSEDELGDLAPACIFAERIGDPKKIINRNGYVIGEVGRPPDLVMEVGSPFGGGVLDYTVRREGYASLGAREYWRFDPSGGEHYDTALAGDTLVDGRYEPIEIVSEPDGRHWGYSDVLGLEFWWEDGKLRFRDPVSGEFLPTLNESEAARQAAERRAQSAERRVAELEAELRRRSDE